MQRWITAALITAALIPAHAYPILCLKWSLCKTYCLYKKNQVGVGLDDLLCGINNVRVSLGIYSGLSGRFSPFVGRQYIQLRKIYYGFE
jgi:hypothetical protein